MAKKAMQTEGLLLAFVSFYSIQYALTPYETLGSLFSGAITFFIIVAYIEIPNLRKMPLRAIAFSAVFGLPTLSVANYFLAPSLSQLSSGSSSTQIHWPAMLAYFAGVGIGLALCHFAGSDTASQMDHEDSTLEVM